MNNLFLNRYPYTDFHELNLSWLIQVITEVQTTLEQFVSINALKYADPIQWNITTQYEKNTIVIDPVSGVAYISVQPVPSGVALTNTDYWTVVFDLGQFVVRASKNFSLHYEADTTTSATFASTAGDWLVWGDTLYKALVNITPGDTYVVDGNIEHFTMEELVGHLDDLLTTDKTSIVNAINELASRTGELDDLTTTDKTSIVNAINELDSRTGELNDLATTDKSSIVNAINELDGYCDGLANGYNILDSHIGTLNNLTTTDKTSLVNAINEIDGDVGDLNNLTTTDNTSIVNAINELENDISNTADAFHYLRGKKILIIGDSLSDETFYEGMSETCWVTPFKNILDGVCTIDNKSASGRKMTSLPGNIGNFMNASDNYDIVIIQLGTNDGYGASPTPMQAYDFGTYDPTTFQGAIVFAYLQIMNVNWTVAPEIWFLTPPPITLQLTNGAGTSLDLYRKAIEGFCKGNNCHFIDGASMPNITYSPVLSKLKNMYQSDGVHFDSAYASIFADYVLSHLLSGGIDASTDSDGVQMDFSAYIDSSLSGGMGAYADGDGTVTIVPNISGTANSANITILSSLPDKLFSLAGQSAFRLESTLYDSTNDRCVPVMIWNTGTTLDCKIYDYSSSFNFSWFTQMPFKCRELIYKRSM